MCMVVNITSRCEQVLLLVPILWYHRNLARTLEQSMSLLILPSWHRHSLRVDERAVVWDWDILNWWKQQHSGTSQDAEYGYNNMHKTIWKLNTDYHYILPQFSPPCSDGNYSFFFLHSRTPPLFKTGLAQYTYTDDDCISHIRHSQNVLMLILLSVLHNNISLITLDMQLHSLPTTSCERPWWLFWWEHRWQCCTSLTPHQSLQPVDIL